MIGREKVIYSIERCTCHVPDACRDCAYNAGHPYNECVEMLLKDTLSLLKAQEQDSKKIIVKGNVYECPWCGEEVFSDTNPNYCGYCGKAVKWDG